METKRSGRISSATEETTNTPSGPEEAGNPITGSMTTGTRGTTPILEGRKECVTSATRPRGPSLRRCQPSLHRISRHHRGRHHRRLRHSVSMTRWRTSRKKTTSKSCPSSTHLVPPLHHPQTRSRHRRIRSRQTSNTEMHAKRPLKRMLVRQKHSRRQKQKRRRGKPLRHRALFHPRPQGFSTDMWAVAATYHSTPKRLLHRRHRRP